MEMKEIESAVEGILFASGEPVQTDRICVALEMDRPTVEQVLQKLMDYYAYERRGIRLLRMEDTWQLCSAPDYADVIRKAFEIRKPAKLSQPARSTAARCPPSAPSACPGAHSCNSPPDGAAPGPRCPGPAPMPRQYGPPPPAPRRRTECPLPRPLFPSFPLLPCFIPRCPPGRQQCSRQQVPPAG